MRVLPVVLLFAFAATANSSLLEMSRTLWTKVLEGGLTKIGALDPLRVPVVKVDQSEGNTSYRMILRNLEIMGLNSSTLESVHIGRGRLRSNLSEHEAGYVSYTDQRELDTIRYRFHTVVKEPKGGESENLEVKPIPDLENSKSGQGQYGRVRNDDRTNHESSSRYQDDRRRTGPQGQGSNHESSSRYQENQQRGVPQGQGSNYESSSRYQENQQRGVPQGQGSNYESSSRYQNNRRRPGAQGQGSNDESSSRYQEDRQRATAEGQGSNDESSSRYQEDQQRGVPQGQGSNYESSSRYQSNRQRPGAQGQGSNYDSSSRYQEDRQRATPQGQGSNYESSSRYQSNRQRPGAQGQGSNDESSSRYQEDRQRATPQGQGSNYESSSRYQNNRQRPGVQGQGSTDESSSRYQEDRQRATPQGQGSNDESSSRYQEDRQKATSQGQGSNDESSSRYQEDRQRATPQGQGSKYASSSRYQENQQREVPQGQGSSYEYSSRYQENQQREVPQGQGSSYEYSSRYPSNLRASEVAQGHRSNYEASRTPDDQGRYYSQPQNPRRPSDDSKVGQESSARASSRSSAAQQPAGHTEGQGRDGPGNVQIVYAERLRTPEETSRNERTGVPSCVGSCQYRRRQGSSEFPERQREGIKAGGRTEEIGVAASVNSESRRAYFDARVVPARSREDSVKGRTRYDGGATGENRYAASFERKSNDEGKYQGYTDGRSSRLEDQPGYVDIVYADEKDNETRHFGNLRVEQGKDKTVYSLEDVLRDLRDHKRFIVHNFTEGEALTKKNDAVRAASETKRIKDMVRYAKEYQERQGFYEQGMQLIYHYGDGEDDDKSDGKLAKRNKRAHLDGETEDDVMHVIMRIRVPMLRVNAGYVLMGKVGKQVLRGNGLLAGNFTEVIGDFTLELKKVDEDTMIVRAARARLSAEDKNITLEGMDEEGPVKEILTHGLLAAEAVAAMLADDLATKALTEKTADSIIYKMYKNLPVENS